MLSIDFKDEKIESGLLNITAQTNEMRVNKAEWRREGWREQEMEEEAHLEGCSSAPALLLWVSDSAA